jgi:hypothetical protein
MNSVKKIKHIMSAICIMLLMTSCSATKLPCPPCNKKLALNLPYPPELKLRDVSFVVIHEDNADQVFQSLRDKNIDPVVFGLTSSNYENLAINIEEIKQHIILLRKSLDTYKEHYGE